jgi:hypothetical protein
VSSGTPTFFGTEAKGRPRTTLRTPKVPINSARPPRTAATFTGVDHRRLTAPNTSATNTSDRNGRARVNTSPVAE